MDKKEHEKKRNLLKELILCQDSLRRVYCQIEDNFCLDLKSIDKNLSNAINKFGSKIAKDKNAS